MRFGAASAAANNSPRRRNAARPSARTRQLPTTCSTGASARPSRVVVAIMTPEMSAASITFGRRTAVIEEVLQRHFDITRSGSGVNLDEDDNWYLACYGEGETARELIERRHEKLTLDALRDLSKFLGALRDERKVVFMVSDGWVPTRPSEKLATVAP